MAVAWIVFAPVQVGGRTSYVIVNGNSMEPKFHGGDLVITREMDGYAAGDVAAYRHPEIGPVIHRIVERDGERFVFKGDNNSWLDSYRPESSEFIGAAWIQVPSIGGLVGRMRGPGSMAVLAGIMGVIAMTTFVTNNSHTKDGRKRPRSGRPSAGKGAGSPRQPGDNGQGLLTLLAALMIASLVLGVFAFGRPASRTVSEEVGYEHMGKFGYSADVPAGVYDMKEVRTGEPVFRRLARTVRVRFDYGLTSEEARMDGVSGTYRLIAEISDPDTGWKRTMLLQDHTGFSGGFTAMADLDLSEAQRLIEGMEKRTGYHSDRYAVTVAPEVFVQGTLADQSLDDEFSPRLDFWLDPIRLQLQTPIATDPSQPSEGTNPLEPSKEGSVSRSHTEPNTLSILVFEPGVSVARKLSLFGLALSSMGLLFVGVPMLRALRGDEPERIRSRYGPLLVSTQGGDLESESRVVRVFSFRDLARLAENGGQSILHQTTGGIHDYYLRDTGVIYHYQIISWEIEAPAEVRHDAR